MTSDLTKPPRKRTQPASFAPGFGIVHVSGHAGDAQACPGCDDRHPPQGGCSACLSESVAVILYDKARDRHAMPLCFECVKVVLEWHKEIAAEKAKIAKNAAAKRAKQRRQPSQVRPARKAAGGAA